MQEDKGYIWLVEDFISAFNLCLLDYCVICNNESTTFVNTNLQLIVLLFVIYKTIYTVDEN